MQQTALNLIAIGIFLVTMTSLTGPMLHISPLIPAGVTVVVMGLATVDTLNWQSRGATVFLDFFASAEQRQRIVDHEAGHFLAAYLLGIPITGYTLTAWDALRQGQVGLGGVSFDQQAVGDRLNDPQEMNLLLERLSTTLMAGIAAEKLIYKEAQGGNVDRQQLRQMMTEVGVPAPTHEQRERWALLQAENLLKRYQTTHRELAEAMSQRQSLEECYQVIEQSTDYSLRG